MTNTADHSPLVRSLTNEAGNVVGVIELVELDPIAVQIGSLRMAPVAASQGLAEVGTCIAESCAQIMHELKANLGSIAPDELELTFGVSVGAEGGLPLISKVSGGATFEVKARWSALNG